MSFTVKGVTIVARQVRGLNVTLCGRQACHSGHVSSLSVSSCHALHVILRGRGIFRCRGVEHRLAAGDLFLLPPQEKVFYQADAADPWAYYFFNLVGSDVADWMAFAGLSTPLVRSSLPEEAMRHFAAAFEAAEKRPSDGFAVVGELLTAVSRLRPDAGAPAPESYTEMARRYIESNYHQPVRIGRIADCIGIDRTHLYRQFKRDTGLSPQAWLLAFRLRQAQKLMDRADLTLTEIALSTGFSDLAHFSHAYRARHGVSPQADRAAFQGQPK